jgi:hypothetical protein
LSVAFASPPSGQPSSAAKVLLIVFGALTATKAVADDLVGAESAGVVLTYAIIGVATATAAGLLAAFKWEEKAAQFTVLTTRATSWRREMRLAYSPAVADSPGEAKLIATLQKVVANANAELEGLELEAAKLGRQGRATASTDRGRRGMRAGPEVPPPGSTRGRRRG